MHLETSDFSWILMNAVLTVATMPSAMHAAAVA